MKPGTCYLVVISSVVLSGLAGYYIGAERQMDTWRKGRASQDNASMVHGGPGDSWSKREHLNARRMERDKASNTNKKDVHISPDEAKEMMRNAAMITDQREKAAAYRNIMRRLCEAGYTEDAWQLIVEDPGLVRDAQVYEFFTSSTLALSTCLSKVAMLRDDSEMKTALAGYLQNNLHDINRIVNDYGFVEITNRLNEKDSHALDEILTSALRMSFDNASSEERKEEVNQMVIDYHKKGIVSNSDYATFIARNINSNEPFDMWQWISDSSMGVSSPEGSFESQARAAIVGSMVNQDPEKAMAQLKASSSDGSSYDLYLGLESWTKTDPGAAYNWFDDNRASLTADQQDSAARAFAVNALAFREFEGAERWVEKIKNEDLRSDLLKKIKLGLSE